MVQENSWHVHKSPPMVCILINMNLVHTILSCFFKIHSNIIIPPCICLHNDLFPLFSRSFDHFHNIWREVQFMKFLVMYVLFSSSPSLPWLAMSEFLPPIRFEYNTIDPRYTTALITYTVSWKFYGNYHFYDLQGHKQTNIAKNQK
jgi:hypothetical protein